MLHLKPNTVTVLIASVEGIAGTADPRAQLIERTRRLFQNGLSSGLPYPPLTPGTRAAKLVPGLLACRLAADLTQPEVAVQAGIARGTLARLERLRRRAHPQTVEALARALGVPAQSLTAATQDLPAIQRPARSRSARPRMPERTKSSFHRYDASVTAEVKQRFVEINGIRMHVVEAGAGPLVILLHGFPESWYSWRHQLTALAEAGLHVVAPDQRGYGQTDRPDAVEAYSMFHLVGDVIGLLDALGEERALVVGHDWGGPVAWSTALFRPDRVRGVVGLSVPYRPRGERAPLSVYRAALGPAFYQLYFQKPGVAEADLQRDVRRTIRLVLYGGSGQNSTIPNMMVEEGHGFLGDIELPDRLPNWIDESDIDFYTAEFERTGFAGGLNWYRNIDRNWELTAPWQGATIDVPAAYVVGDRDMVYHFPGVQSLITNLQKFVPNLQQSVVLEGCGHWTQQERAADVNRVLIDFAQSL